MHGCCFDLGVWFDLLLLSVLDSGFRCSVCFLLDVIGVLLVICF